MWAGLIRLGWGWPPIQTTLPLLHGPLMVSGFLGTVIGLERAVALERRWTYAAPLLTAVGATVLIFGMDGWLGPLLITLGSIVLLITLSQILRIHVTGYMMVIIAGSLCWLAGNLFWLAGRPVPLVVVWWIGFPLLTIVGERLELNRFLQLPVRVTTMLLLCVIVFLAGAVVSALDYATGMRVAGAGMTLSALWLLRYDIAGRRIKVGGQARFIGISLLSGYGWLLFGGVAAMVYGGLTAGPFYDAILHSIFLGFVFVMIFAHAPIIFPAILQRPYRYAPRLYSHLILLHITLALRVAGDLLFWQPGRLWGGLLNVLVLLLFLGNTIASSRK